MKKRKKQFFALLMVICMMVTFMPSFAFATDEASADAESAVQTEAMQGEEAAAQPSEDQKEDKEEAKEAAEEAKTAEDAAEPETQETEQAEVQEEPEAVPEETETEDVAFDATKADYLSYDPLFISKYANDKYVDASEIDMNRFINVVTAMKGMVSYNVNTQSKFEVTEDNYIAGMNCEIPVYNIDDNSDYYVAVPDVNKFNKGFKMYDMKVGYNNDYAETISGWKYEKGILYIPKKAVTSPSYSHETPESQMLAVQLNYAIGSDFTKSIPVQVLSKDEPTEKTVHTANLFDISNLAVKTGVKNRKASDIDVYLNGQMIPINSGAWTYNKSTGELSIQALPGVVSNINVVFKQRTTAEAVKDATVSAIESVTPNAFAAAGEASDQAGMKFFRDDKGNIVTLDVRRMDIFVGWRGYYTATIHYGRENGQDHDEAEAYKKSLRGWEDSINYLYGGYTTYAGAGSSDDEVYDSKIIPLWSISSYAVGEDLGRSSSTDSGTLTPTELVEHHTSETTTASKTIYQWMFDNRNNLKQSKKSTGNMEGNGIGGANNFAMNFPKTLTGSSVNLVDPNSPDANGNAGRTNRNITFNLEGINETGYWFAASCNELGKATEGSDGVNKNRVYVTCLGIGEDYAVLAFVHNVAGRKQSACAIYKFKLAPSAYVKVKKTAGETDVDFLTEAPNNYSLAGAEYTLYKDSSLQTPATDVNGNAAVLITDENGDTGMLEMEPGTYYAKETKASKGFLLDSGVAGVTTARSIPVTLTIANTKENPATINSTDDPTFGKLIKLRKKNENGDYGWRKLLGAQYTLKYYNVDPSTSDVSDLTPTRSWVFETTQKKDEKNNSYAGIDFDSDTPISGDDFYMETVGSKTVGSNEIYYFDDDPATSSEKRVMPIGVYTIEETKAPEGLSRNTTVYYGSVKQDSNGAFAVTRANTNSSDSMTIEIGTENDVVNDEDLQSVKIAINKYDKETDEQTAQGADRKNVKGSLAGAVYEVYYDDNDRETPELVGTITTDENGYGELTKRTLGKETYIGTDLRVGNYLVKEVTASPGYVIDKYVLNGENTEEIPNGEIEVICGYESDGTPVTKTIKGTYEDGQHLFRTRAETLDTSVFEYTVKSDDTVHHTPVSKTDITTGKELPGATLQVLDSEGNIIEEWVSTDKPHDIVALHDETQGLKDGKYTLREITAPYGYDVAEDVEFEVSSKQIVNKVKMENKPITIKTTATDTETSTHQGVVSSTAEVKDVVKITGLYEGREYVVKGRLIDKATKEIVKDPDGNDSTAEKAFAATGDEMEIELTFKVDASKFDKNTTTVAFERLERTSKVHEVEADIVPVELQKHEDPDDEDQTIHYGGIVGTTATDENGISQNVLAGKDTVIVDTVEYKNLSTRETYTLEGELFDKTTNQNLGVKVSIPFTPKTESGTTQVVFKFDASSLPNHDLVVFESLYLKGKLIDEHKDPNDEKQTVHIPEIGTKAGKVKSGKVTDRVAYKNLIPGQEYVMKGWLINKSTGKKIKGSDGEVRFTPTSSSGYVEVTLKLKGKSGKLVAFEECYAVKGNVKTKIGEHKDKNDKDQTVTVEKGSHPKTGEDYMIYLYGGMFGLATLLAVVMRKKALLKK